MIKGLSLPKLNIGLMKKTKFYTGIEVDRDYIRIGLLQKDEDGFSLPIMPFEIHVSGDDEQDGKTLKEELERRGLNIKSAAFSIPVADVLYKTLTIPKVEEKELIDAIEWNIKEDIENFSKTKPHYDWDILSTEGEYQNVLVVITKEEAVNRILTIADKANINIDFIDTVGTSLLNLAFLQKDKIETNKKERNICIIHLDKSESFLLFSNNNLILQSLDFSPQVYGNLDTDEKEREVIRIINDINYFFYSINEPKIIYTSGYFVRYPEIKAYMQLKFSTRFILEDLDPVIALGLNYKGNYPLGIYNNVLSLAYRSVE
ncbi:MAG: type IV pilus biogenesis protein PilM [Sulfurihydrogenibium sp.]|uniref:type IV pilus biogenesis protein PilM n=1 Tax=Sulfurihydrogenibium sp. TaxID=2053621 RepID=UPI003C79AC27